MNSVYNFVPLLTNHPVRIRSRTKQYENLSEFIQLRLVSRDDVASYCTSVRGLVLRLLEAISESLGLKADHIGNSLGKHGQHMALNYYPPCPQPELTYGLPGHTDPNLITILLQDDVPGLQVLRDGKWVAVNPIPYTFIVNIGDQMQVCYVGVILFVCLFFLFLFVL